MDNATRIRLETSGKGVLLPVRAQPGARTNAVTGIHAGRLKVAVTAAPEKGKANRAILKLLAKRLQVKRSQLDLVSGQTSSQKKVLVQGVSADQLRKRIEELPS